MLDLCTTRSRVILLDEARPTLEPIEEVTIEVDDKYSGVVIEKIAGQRMGDLLDTKTRAPARTTSSSISPGATSSATTVSFSSTAASHAEPRSQRLEPHNSAIDGRRQSVQISMDEGINIANAPKLE